MAFPYAHLLALLWTLGILAGCSIPGKDLPQVDLVSFDKVVHFVIFGGFGWLWMRALRKPLIAKTWWVLTTGVAYAVLTEVYQGLLPFERTPDPNDALANALGLVAAVLLFRFFEKRKSTSIPS